MITLGAQYYRPPFPETHYWEDDIRMMKESGLNTVQLWVVWSWVESKPGTFCFDDYDRLVSIAEKNGMGVVLSTIAELHPYWIHEVIPGSEMVTNMGQRVVSSNRAECHFGLTPGGCFDHPEVWKRMRAFIGATARQYASAPHIRGWDAWNELRWNVNADGLVCYCDHTLAAFRSWLMRQHGSLDALNNAWKRRYRRLEDILPGKMIGRPYTEMMAFQRFITERANNHAKARYDVIKAIDPKRPVTVHGGAPTTHHAGDINIHNMAIDRGNDWAFADHIDGVGFSTFPKWWKMDDSFFTSHVRSVGSAAQRAKKHFWISELQGGRVAMGFKEPSASVDGRSQQRWVWNGIAAGADTILFWCWRDEVFGQESNNCGLIGNDGKREDRIAALKKTGKMLVDHEKLLDGYRPATPEVGVFFSPSTYYLEWSQDGCAGKSRASLDRYCKTLVKLNIPYTVIEEEHLDALNDIRVLFMPRILVMGDTVAERLRAFVESGGTLVTESECGAFDNTGIYRYPEDRFLARSFGIREIGRRPVTGSISMVLDKKEFVLTPELWITPFTPGTGKVFAESDEGPLALAVNSGKGNMIAVASFLGDIDQNAPVEVQNSEFGKFLSSVVEYAGVVPDICVTSPKIKGEEYVQVNYGRSGEKPIVFVFFPVNLKETKLSFKPGFLSSTKLLDIVSERTISVKGNTITVRPNDMGISILIEQ